MFVRAIVVAAMVVCGVAAVSLGVLDRPVAGTGTAQSSGVMQAAGLSVQTLEGVSADGGEHDVCTPEYADAPFCGGASQRECPDGISVPENEPCPDPCTTEAGDHGILLEDDTAGQQLHGGILQDVPPTGDPDHAGPVSGPLNDTFRDDLGMEAVGDEVTCLVSIVGEDGDAL